MTARNSKPGKVDRIGVPARVGIVGVGGYAEKHIEMLRRLASEGQCVLVGAFVRSLDRYAAQIEKLEAEGVRCVASFSELIDLGLDLVSVPTSILSHETYTVEALQRNCSVLVDKPPAPTLQGLDRMLAAERESSAFCAVLFQTLSTPLFLDLEHWLIRGELGALLREKCMILEPRPVEYYQRNGWAGRWRNDDEWVLDGPMKNAMAHELNALVHLCESAPGEQAAALDIACEMYRAHDIEGDDTSCLPLGYRDGPTLHYFVTHAGFERLRRLMRIDFERATVWLWFDNTSCPRRMAILKKEGPLWKRGSIRVDKTTPKPHLLAYRNALQVAAGSLPRSALHCPLQATRPFTVAIDGAHRSAEAAVPFPPEFIERESRRREGRGARRDSVAGRDWVRIKDLERIMKSAYASEELFSEMCVPWARPSKPIRLDASGGGLP